MATETPVERKKGGKSILSILKLVATILAILVFTITVVSNMAVVYIVFAPDTFPKPFYLVYYIPGQTPQIPVAIQNGENTSASGEQTQTADAGSEVSMENLLPGQGISLDTGTKIVNLAEPGGRKFIRTNVVLEFAPNDPVFLETAEAESGGGEGEASAVSPRDAYQAQFLTELEGKLPMINDAIISLLSSKTFVDVSTEEGKNALRDEIMAAVNSRLPEYHVFNVYFTEFVMQ
jgi:flagellar protein FliL